MQFPGYWVSENNGQTFVHRDVFDETDLSDHSNWTEAWQNDEPAYLHGFVDPLKMLHAVCEKVAGPLTEAVSNTIHNQLSSDDAYKVSSIEDLARLVQMAIPAMMKPLDRATRDASAVLPKANDEIPFD